MMKNIFKDNNKNYIYGGLYGSSGAYIISKLSKDFKNIVIILDNNNEINNLCNELRIFIDKNIYINKFLDIESLPYEEIIMDNDIISSRIQAYNNILNYDQNITIASYSSIIKKISPDIKKNNFFNEINYNYTYNNLIHIINELNYERTEKVLNKGEYAIRGPIIDVFSMVEDEPIRVTFDDKKIETIKTFNIHTQKTKLLLNKFILSYYSEIIIDDDVIKNYKVKSKKLFDNEYLEDIEFSKITNKINYPSSYNILPLLYNNTLTLFDLLPNNGIFLTTKDIKREISKINKRFLEYYKTYRNTKYILKPDNIIINYNEFLKLIANYKKINLSNYKIIENENNYNASIKKLPSVLINNTYKNPFQNLKKFIDNNLYKILICVNRDSLKIEILNFLQLSSVPHQEITNIEDFYHNNKKKVCVLNDDIDEGFIDYKLKIAFVSAKDIFGIRSVSVQRKKKNNFIEEYISDISLLEIDAPIVHDNYGIGRYKGLINMDIEGIQTELIKIEYANSDVLYIPVTSINLLKKYTGHNGLNIPLHTLGTNHWIKIKNKAKNKINDIAVELLEIESKRMSSKGFSFETKIRDYEKFIEHFPFVETEDQNKTINEVVSDMSKLKPMDRIICGDVGFGKTEVIMRASFIASMNDKQTMILAPTTILVEQHFKTFSKRFEDTAINIGKLSRLQSTRERSLLLKNIVDGKVDIVIGTHALLSRKIIFKNLKLLIIDEEHKFGVRAKEKIKKIKENIDVISLTATPIPRTLNAALSQIKDLSLIETPPENRKSIVTRILKWDSDIIKDAINREINRGGQIYYVHNEIKTMEKVIERIRLLDLKIKIGKIHGQLDNKIIENEMNRFLNKEYDLLLCTSIIESGLDIANVNTIIINNSNKFGLSQLHQIRGRVGRTGRQAYAYLIIPEKSMITKDAQKRLEAIDSVSSLGGGLEIATHDLEIRGAGEILGEEQSGQIYEVGYAMFTDLLNKSIKLLKTGKSEIELNDIEVDVNKSCLIPSDYINDIYTRLKYYKKISSCKNKDEINITKDEIIDIFGPIPEFLNNLFILTMLKLQIINKNIKYIKIINEDVKIEINDFEKIKTNNIIENAKSNEMKISKDNLIHFKADDVNFENQSKSISNIINKLF